MVCLIDNCNLNSHRRNKKTEMIKYYLGKILLFLKFIDISSAILMMLPQKDKYFIEEEIKRIEEENVLDGFEKRKVVVRFVLTHWLRSLDYSWLNTIFDALPEKSKERLANSIVEVLFFNIKQYE